MIRLSATRRPVRNSVVSDFFFPAVSCSSPGDERREKKEERRKKRKKERKNATKKGKAGGRGKKSAASLSKFVIKKEFGEKLVWPTRGSSSLFALNFSAKNEN